MSLNQVTSPLSTVDIQAKSITVPDYGGEVVPIGDNNGPIIFSPELTAPNVLQGAPAIRSHYVQYGKTYTIVSRIKFTSGTSGTTPVLKFIVNIPGFVFRTTGETAPITKHTGPPVYTDPVYDGAIQGIAGTNELKIILLQAGGVAAADAVLAAAGQAYDISFTMTALSA